MAADTPADRDRVSRNDIEAKLREIRGEVDSSAQAAKPAALTIVAVAAVVVIGAAYMLGRRKGRLKSTVVEIRRV
ncbi:MAG TPA: hypothetical protein VM345_19765 [Acidimicrobiales bacterium]|jgi:hypothetical protein|nr:hypothetical protein [Acidimicrobiales bacterium]